MPNTGVSSIQTHRLNIHEPMPRDPTMNGPTINARMRDSMCINAMNESIILKCFLKNQPHYCATGSVFFTLMFSSLK